ncbi:pentapeptide repeat-containing protein [Nostoc sp. LEGE 12447]|nr:pentapeptide repeat-containing protein [Nostoc sp. LEGE 12447]
MPCPDVAEEFVSAIQAKISVCPISDLMEQANSLNLKDPESAFEVACAIFMGVSAIITRNPQNFDGADLLIRPVEDLEKLLELEKKLEKPYLPRLAVFQPLTQEVANLSAGKLREAELYGTDLHGVDVHGMDLSGVNLSGANLYGADLSGADLSGANLRDADLSGADLSGANLSDADLSGADLRGANLSGADLSGANLNMTHRSYA